MTAWQRLDIHTKIEFPLMYRYRSERSAHERMAYVRTYDTSPPTRVAVHSNVRAVVRLGGYAVSKAHPVSATVAVSLLTCNSYRLVSYARPLRSDRNSTSRPATAPVREQWSATGRRDQHGEVGFYGQRTEITYRNIMNNFVLFRYIKCLFITT